ncbi:MAG: class I SAM-dependent methyltransferase [Sulfolobaceae archaeon]|nr:class I SAM-dependent methyltransferase [Sulfolobaceae archaeon]
MHRHHHYDMFLSDQRREFEDPEKFLPELLDHNQVIVDLGCGPGYYCQYLVKYASKLYCIDIDDEALKIVKEIVPESITMKDLRGIPDGSVDVILLANSFHDMDNKEDVVNEIRRVLKEGGKVIIIDWKKDATPFGPPVFLRMDKEDYLKYFRGFDVVKEFDVGPYHFGLLLIKK